MEGDGQRLGDDDVFRHPEEVGAAKETDLRQRGKQHHPQRVGESLDCGGAGLRDEAMPMREVHGIRH